MESLLQVENLSKSFGTLPVIQQVSFQVDPGEVVGLTGSIGSGKSVLVMLLSGLYEPDEGMIHFASRRLSFPFRAPSLGIGVIHQRPTLADHLDVVSNIFLGNEIGWPAGLGICKIINYDKMAREANRLLSLLDVHVNSLDEKVSNLSGEQRQMIAIARIFTFTTRMIIIDEPTVSLSYPYQQRLLSQIGSWQQQGISVLFSSNNMDHIFAVTDRILVLHQGRKVADLRTDETTREEIVSLLMGTPSAKNPSPAIWDFDTFNRIRENAEKMRFHQMLLEKDLAAEDTLNRQLTGQLAEQVEALDRVNLALQDAQRRLLSEREQERKKLARELHDEIIQDLLSINYELEGMQTNLPVSLTDDLMDVRQAIRGLVDDLRSICSNLRPPTIDSLGLGAAIQSYTRDWISRSGIQLELDLPANLGRLPETIELAIFRIIQEGLSNVWRHSHASKVKLALRLTSPRSIEVSLQDNGLGINEEYDLVALTAKGHFGLMGISERVALLGGRFRLQRSSEGGAMMVVEIPHPRMKSVSEDEK
jgi:signal transduction histidine kinase